MATKYTNIFKIYPNWDNWFETMPSGNPGVQLQAPKIICSREIVQDNCAAQISQMS
jgi:hypothetical protein